MTTPAEGRALARRRLGSLLLLLAAAGFSAVPGAEPNQAQVRPAAVAGSWYPGDPESLAAYVDGLLEKAAANVGERPRPLPVRALIAPHAGYMYSGGVAADAYARVKDRRYDRVLVLGPAHRGQFRGLGVANLTHYRTPLGEIPLDLAALERLRASPLVVADDAADRQEHSIEMQLPMLQRALAPGWKLVPVLVGALEPADYPEAAALLRPLLDAQTLLVVSGDFTHYGPRYGFLPFAPDAKIAERLRGLDMGAIEHILDADAAGFLDYQQSSGITACAAGPVAVLLNLLSPGVHVELVTYTTSGALTGDYRNSVSYAAIVIRGAQALGGAADPVSPGAASEPALGADEMALLHRLAELGVELAVGQRESQDRLEALLAQLPEPLKRPSGAFVTLRNGGHLRGCIGYIEPIEPLFKAVLENAISAALHDRRFPPLQAEELTRLEIEISVLTPPQPIESPQQFEVGTQGIILRKNGRQAVYLPQVAIVEGWNREQTLSHLARKAGLDADAWRQGAELLVFTSQEYDAPYSRRDH